MKAPAPMLWTRPAGRKKTSPAAMGWSRSRLVGYRRGIGFGIHAAVETDTQTGAARLRNDVPHLGLAVHPVTLPRQTVVGVYLNREILAGVDEFDQQRKFVAETFVIALSHQFGAVAVDQLRQGNTLAGPLGDDRFVSGDARQLPALADRPHGGLDALVGGDLLAAPDHGTQERFEFQRIHDIYRFCKILFYRNSRALSRNGSCTCWECNRPRS